MMKKQIKTFKVTIPYRYDVTYTVRAHNENCALLYVGDVLQGKDNKKVIDANIGVSEFCDQAYDIEEVMQDD